MGACRVRLEEEPSDANTPGERIPTFAVPLPGGGPTDLMINPLLGFPTRPPGAPVETYTGFGFASSGLLQKQTPPGAPPNKSMSLVFDTPGTYNSQDTIN